MHKVLTPSALLDLTVQLREDQQREAREREDHEETDRAVETAIPRSTGGIAAAQFRDARYALARDGHLDIETATERLSRTGQASRFPMRRNGFKINTGDRR